MDSLQKLCISKLAESGFGEEEVPWICRKDFRKAKEKWISFRKLQLHWELLEKITGEEQVKFHSLPPGDFELGILYKGSYYKLWDCGAWPMVGFTELERELYDQAEAYLDNFKHFDFARYIEWYD